MQVNGKLRPNVDENAAAAASPSRLSVMKTFWGSLSELRERGEKGRERGERDRERQ